MEIAGRRVVVLGLARQGTALARWLIDQGAQVTVSDAKPAAELSDALNALQGSPIRFEVGGHPLSLLDRCDLLCLSGGVPTDMPIVLEARKRGIPLANDAQLFLERCPAKTIGITGSAGKTTTTALVGEMGKSSASATSSTGVASHVWVGGNIGNPLIADLDSIEGSDLVVMELSSFQLELMTISPPVAAVLNVTPNHLDRHPSMEAYIAAKAHILDYQSPQDTAVIGYDDAAARSLASRTRAALMYFGMGDSPLPRATVRDDRVLLERNRIEPVCALSEIRLRGEHNVLNVLAACALADAVGISTEVMRSAIVSFTGVPHRLQLVRELNGVRYYDDSIATAPERLIAAIKSFHEPIVLLAGGRDKHLPWNEAAELISRRVRQLILFGEMAELVERAVRTASVPSAALRGSSRDASHTLVHRVETLAEAVAKAAEVTRPGDVVLLAPGGTSFDAFKDFAERGDKFQEYVRGL